MRKFALLLYTPLILLRSQSTTPDTFTARITAELEAKNSRAAKIFVAANDARERRDWKEAERLYAEVRRLEPQFFHATRRLCSVLLDQERKDEAVAFCREALQVGKSPDDCTMLIHALLHQTGTAKPSPEQVREARDLAWELLKEPVLEPHSSVAVCLAAWAGQDRNMLRRGVERLRGAEPNSVPTHYFAWLLAVSEGAFEDAAASLRRAREAGMPEAAYAELMVQTDKARPWWPRAVRAAAWIVGAWLGGMALLFGAGAVLSRSALRAAASPPQVRTGASTGLASRLRQTYRSIFTRFNPPRTATRLRSLVQ